jgi:hypothetical protein
MYDKSILDKLNKNEKDCEIINENDFDFNKFSISLLQKIFPNWANIIFDIILLLFVCMIIHYCSSIMIFFKGFPETRNEKYVLTDHGEITDYITKEQYVKAKYVQTHIWSGFLTFFLLLPVLFYYKRLLSKDNQTIFNQ